MRTEQEIQADIDKLPKPWINPISQGEFEHWCRLQKEMRLVNLNKEMGEVILENVALETELARIKGKIVLTEKRWHRLHEERKKKILEEK